MPASANNKAGATEEGALEGNYSHAKKELRQPRSLPQTRSEEHHGAGVAPYVYLIFRIFVPHDFLDPCFKVKLWVVLLNEQEILHKNR